MRYGFFDDAAREYVIDRVDVPVSLTNYLGTQRMGTVISHNAGGYSWLDSPEHHRITRFRPNGVRWIGRATMSTCGMTRTACTGPSAGSPWGGR